MEYSELINTNSGVVKICLGCNHNIWIRLDSNKILNEKCCPMCKTEHTTNTIFEMVNTTKSYYIDTNSGINGRDWQKGLPSDFKEGMNNFKKRHNNGKNNMPVY